MGEINDRVASGGHNLIFSPRPLAGLWDEEGRGGCNDINSYSSKTNPLSISQTEIEYVYTLQPTMYSVARLLGLKPPENGGVKELTT